MKQIIILLGLIFCLLSCNKKRKVEGIYISTINENDTLKIFRNNKYLRIFEGEKQTSGWDIDEEGCISVYDWINHNQTFGDDGGWILHGRYNFFTNECYEIQIDDNGYSYKRIK